MLDAVVTQAAFGELVGVSQQAVSELQARNVLLPGMPARVWLLAYCKHIRDVAAGRDPDGVLVKERSRLAAEQADAVALKNAIARQEYAPVALLTDVLATASAAVVDHFDALPGDLRKACPDLPQEARDAIATAIASARNEWIRSTADLVARRVDELTEPEEDEEGGVPEEVAA